MTQLAQCVSQSACFGTNLGGTAEQPFALKEGEGLFLYDGFDGFGTPAAKVDLERLILKG